MNQQRTILNKPANLVVYPVTNVAEAKVLFGALLGVEPYADSPYYVGYRASEMEIGLVPNGPATGPIYYYDTTDIAASLKQLTDAGATIGQDISDVGGGLKVATVKDANGNTIGLRQK